MFAIKVAVATGILVWAVIEDLRTRKFSNRSFVIASVSCAVLAVALSGFRELIPASLGFGAGLALFLPLVLMGIIGAGDMKLMAAFGILVGWNAVLWTGVYGFIWGAVFGVVQVIMKGQLRMLVQNLTALAITRGEAAKSGAVVLHRIPFTAPLLLGWLSHLVLSGVWR